MGRARRLARTSPQSGGHELTLPVFGSIRSASQCARSTAALSIATRSPAPSCQPWPQRSHSIVRIWCAARFGPRGPAGESAASHSAATIASSSRSICRTFLAHAVARGPRPVAKPVLEVLEQGGVAQRTPDLAAHGEPFYHAGFRLHLLRARRRFAFRSLFALAHHETLSHRATSLSRRRFVRLLERRVRAPKDVVKNFFNIRHRLLVRLSDNRPTWADCESIHSLCSCSARPTTLRSTRGGLWTVTRGQPRGPQ